MSTLRTLLHAPATARVGEVIEIRATVAHPMETGYRRGSDGQALARNLVRRVQATFNNQPVFSAELHAAIAANPYIAFWLRVPASGELRLVWLADGGITQEARTQIRAV